MEIEKEEKLEDLPEYDFEGNIITVESCYEKAGLHMKKIEEIDTIPAPPEGWDMAQLHGLMTQFSEEQMESPEWTVHLLMLAKGKDPYILGIMFDCYDFDKNNLPRQGAAVFTEPMKHHMAGFDRKVLQTAVHELGHAFNLVHPFEREVGRADSTSFMNYDWRYKQKGHQEQYWKDFTFQFSKEEIMFLRHGPWHKIVPGGVDFHSVKYWTEGTGGYSPYYPEVVDHTFSLTLVPPPTGHIFPFGSPVFLEVLLKNEADQVIKVPAFFLDIKGGLLEILIKRTDAGNKETKKFRPIAMRDYELSSENIITLKPGQSFGNNIQLTFGSAGFTFAEPGNYEITAILAYFYREKGVELIFKSNPITIRIAYPHSQEEEMEAYKLLSPDVGFYFSLGGSDVLSKAENTLEEIYQKRLEQKVVNDPLSAYITRCKAINLSRDFITFSRGKFSVRKAKTTEAVSLFAKLEQAGAQVFDQSTLKGTKELSKVIKKE